MKKADLCVALRGMAAKLDIQWAYAQRLAAEQAAAGALTYNEDGGAASKFRPALLRWNDCGFRGHGRRMGAE